MTMCKLISIKNNLGEDIKVADIKADTIKKIIMLAEKCDKIDYIILFGSSVEERCTEQSDIDIAVVSNVTRSRLFEAKTYREFKKKLYGIDFEQDYDILQFNSIEKIKNSRDFVCKDIISYGKLLYKREGVQYV
jgi:predicted nucleotidyltransferase